MTTVSDKSEASKIIKSNDGNAVDSLEEKGNDFPPSYYAAKLRIMALSLMAKNMR
ncbi:MAG: hypothetical protein ABIH38_02050 [Patescibacteria group bacterium]